MIQRIQTLYLLLAAALTATAAFAPLARFAAAGEEFTLYGFGLRDAAGATAHPTPYMGILLALALALPLVTLLLYKRRMLQIRLCVIELVLLLGAQVMTALYCFLSYRFFSGYEFHAQHLLPTLFLPAAALVPVALAARAIFRDEVLVRSLDRIR